MLKHSFRLVKVVECGNLGYTSVVELSTIPEKWINHSQYGRCRIQNCEEVESHCGHGQGLGLVLPHAAIPVGLRVLRHDRFVPGALSRECHAAHGVHFAAVAVPHRRIVATERHSWRMAGHIMAVSQHLWRASLCSYEHYGRHA